MSSSSSSSSSSWSSVVSQRHLSLSRAPLLPLSQRHAPPRSIASRVHRLVHAALLTHLQLFHVIFPFIHFSPSSSSSAVLIHFPTHAPQQQMTQYTIYGNHLYLFCAIHYVLLNFFRVFYAHLLKHSTYQLISDVYLWLLAALFLLDSVFYLYAFIYSLHVEHEDEMVQLRSTNQSAFEHDVSNDVSSAYDASGPAHQDEAYVRKALMHSCVAPTLDAAAPPQELPPLTWRIIVTKCIKTREGLVESLNIAGCVGYFITASMPFLFYVVEEETARNIDRAINFLDALSMLSFVVASWVMMSLWRDQMLESAQDSKSSTGGSSSSISSATSSSATLLASNCPKNSRSILNINNLDYAFWSHVGNILAGLAYFVSTVYGFYIRMQPEPAHMPVAGSIQLNQNVTGLDADAVALIKEDSTYSYYEASIEWQVMKQKLIAFVGDLFYLLCAILVEFAFYQDARKPTTTSSSLSSTASSYAQDEQNNRSLRDEIEMEKIKHHLNSDDHA